MRSSDAEEMLKHIAKLSGVGVATIISRLSRGLTVEQAIDPGLESRSEIVRRSKEAGIKPGTVYHRLRNMGMSLDEALSVPVGSLGRGGIKADPNSVTQRALAKGLNPGTVIARIQDGWSVEEAISTPIKDKKDGLAAKARRHGINPSTVHSRISSLGWTLEEALTTPVIKGQISQLVKDAGAGLNYGTVIRRLNTGWTLDQALGKAQPPARSSPRDNGISKWHSRIGCNCDVCRKGRTGSRANWDARLARRQAKNKELAAKKGISAEAWRKIVGGVKR